MAEKFKSIYIETLNTHPRTSLKSGLGSTAYAKAMDAVVYGDTMNLNLILMNDGVVDDDISGAPDYFVSASVGLPFNDYVEVTDWYASGSYGYTGSIPLTSSELSASLAASADDFVSLLFQVRLEHTASHARKTYLQSTIYVFKDVADI